MTIQRRQHSGTFKAKVALEAIRGEWTVNELAADYGIHPVQMTQWKRVALEALPERWSGASLHPRDAVADMCVYLSDEIFAIHAPLVVTIDARSTAILTIALASDRSAATWRAHFAVREEHHFSSLGMASDRGLGLVAGSQAAWNMALWVCEYCHECRDLVALLQHWERTAWAAMGKEDDAAHTFARATSASNLAKRLHQEAQAHHACAPAMARYDPLAILRQ